MSPTGDTYRTIVVRVSPEDFVVYGNSAAAAYLGMRREELSGAPLEVLASRVQGEISECFSRPVSGRQVNRLVTDAEGRVFEAKVFSDGGVLDIVLDEVTTAASVSCDLSGVSGVPVEALDEEELRTARQPERRTMTISASRMSGLAAAAERLLPMEVRLMVNAFIEEATEAILGAGCTVQHGGSGLVLGLAGAPRQFSDHALRAVHAACEQNQRLADMRATLLRQGKELLPVTCGIWTGDAVVGTIGNSSRLHYSAVGAAVEHAIRIGRLARPGETLVSEFTLQSLLRTLPPGWQSVQAESETEPDLSEFSWSGEDVVPVPENLRRVVWLVGPGVEEDVTRVELYFDYLWALKVSDLDDPVPVLRVVRPAGVGDAIEFRDDNVVATRFIQTLGKYKLIAVVGVGGMGKVWKAQDRYGNTVAIKVLHPTETASEVQLRRFRREAEVMARLSHRNICRVFEMSEFEDIHFLVMEYVEGLTLADVLQDVPSSPSDARQQSDIPALIRTIRLRRESESESATAEQTVSDEATRVLPTEQALSIFVRICEAVQFAHEHGVLHRDLKPGNILLREDGEPLVADFGLAKLGNDVADFSVTGNVVGTLENMAPEQAASSKSVDERADVYALGTILFQMLTGRRHFKTCGNIVADAQALQDHEPPRPRSINPALDADLDIIIRKALRNSPAERYRSVEALRSDVERYRRGEPISARPVTIVHLIRKSVQRNKVAAISIAVSLLVVIVATGVSVWRVAERADAAEKARVQAENALREAERQGEAAKRSERIAQEQKREAEQRRKEADQALKALKAAREAEKAAQLLAKGARDETAAERAAREKASEALARSEEMARTYMERVAELEQKASSASTPATDPSSEQASAGLRQLSELEDHYARMFPPQRLTLLAATPGVVLQQLGGLQRSISEAILSDPGFAPFWVVKAHVHIAAGELDMAVRSLAQALRFDPASVPDGLNVGNIDLLLNVCREFQKPGANRAELAASLSSGSSLDPVTAGIVRFFYNNRDVARRLSGSMSRESSQPELTVLLMLENGGQGRYAVSDGGLLISGVERVGGLRTIASGRFRKLQIQDAVDIDWTGLASQEIDELDLRGSHITFVPQNPRLLPRTKRLCLEGNGIRDLAFVRMIPTLEELDVSDTGVTDLAPLAMARQLRSLDVGGLSAENLQFLGHLPLERLTLSPGLVADRQSVEALRTFRALRTLRAPSDPPDQTKDEFFRRWDAGEYAR